MNILKQEADVMLKPSEANAGCCVPKIEHSAKAKVDGGCCG